MGPRGWKTVYRRKVPPRAPLGADGRRPWHGFDPILMKFRLRDLQKLGYIDYRSQKDVGISDRTVDGEINHEFDPLPPIDSDFEVTKDRREMFVPKRRRTRFDRIFRRRRSRNDPRELYTPIHPVFRRQNWLDISDDDYRLLDPVLRLASCYLYEPSVMPFFTGLLRREFTKIPNVPQAVAWKFILNRFDPVPYDSVQGRQQQIKTWKTLANMKDCIKWRFNHDNPGTWASSRATKSGGHYEGGLTGFAAVTSGTIVSINKDFLDILKGKIRLVHFPKAEKFDPDAAKLRTSWFMASTLCHEFCHALWFATWNFGDRSGQFKMHDEPFFQDQRVAELGSAFETHLFGITADPLGKNSKLATDMRPQASISAPYGLQAFRWPGATPQSGLTADPALATPAHWGADHFYYYPLPTSSVHRYFTKEFWEHRVATSGILTLVWDPTIMMQSDPKYRGAGRRAAYETGPILYREPVYFPTSEETLRATGFRPKDVSDEYGDSVATEDEYEEYKEYHDKYKPYHPDLHGYVGSYTVQGNTGAGQPKSPELFF